MSDINDQTVAELAALCRIDCDEAMCHEIQRDLTKVLDYFKQLEELDTEDVPPTNHVLAGMANVYREDEITETLSRKTFLEAAPDQVGGMVRVPPVIKNKTQSDLEA